LWDNKEYKSPADKKQAIKVQYGLSECHDDKALVAFRSGVKFTSG